MQIAVALAQPGKLEEAVWNVKHLQFDTHSRGIKGRLGWDYPFQDVCHGDVGRCNLRQVNVLGIGAKIGTHGLGLNAVAYVLRTARRWCRRRCVHGGRRGVPTTGKVGQRKSKQKESQGSCSKYFAVCDGGTLHWLTSVRSNCNEHGALAASGCLSPRYNFLGIAFSLDVRDRTLVDAGCMKIESCCPRSYSGLDAVF